MNLFYSSKVLDDKIILEDQEAVHCSKVLRKRIGDSIHIIDGKGHIYHGQIIEQNQKTVTCKILSWQYHEQPVRYPHIGFGLIKNPNRIEWMIEKIVEIGVASITPLVTRYSERAKIKGDRLNKIILSAAKQSQKYYIPELRPVSEFKDYITDFTHSSYKMVASYSEGQQELRDLTPVEEPVILIGPEGDFSLEEINLAISAGYDKVNLGNSRLRAETAVVVAATLCSICSK